MNAFDHELPGRARERTHDPALKPFTESLDVMGDGSLVLLPTPGHTPGTRAWSCSPPTTRRPPSGCRTGKTVRPR
jgi:hypothetical protein